MSRPAIDSHERADRTSQVDATFETILADIVRGTYSPSTRLPAERELSRQLGASRPTLREALRRLAEWNMVESRRGSGVVVRPSHEWSIEALPAYLRYGRPEVCVTRRCFADRSTFRFAFSGQLSRSWPQ